MSLKYKEDNVAVLLAKIITQSVIIILCLLFILLAPKTVFSKDLPFRLATSMAIVSDENLLLYDYKVYSNEDRFNNGLINDLKIVKDKFSGRNEIMAVKIYGETSTLDVRVDYIFITSPDIPELNIEYHLVKDMSFNGINIPNRTFVMLFKDISVIVNTIYLAIFLIVSISFIAPTSIKLTRNIVNYSKVKKINQNSLT
jgi:hypothetical protein